MSWSRSGGTRCRTRRAAIRGGPGTGKSVLALHLIAELCARHFNAQHATGSRAFTKTLHKVVGSRASTQFRFFNNYARQAPDSIDVLVLDEAHRIRATSNHRYTRKHERSELPQVEELIDRILAHRRQAGLDSPFDARGPPPPVPG